MKYNTLRQTISSTTAFLVLGLSVAVVVFIAIASYYDAFSFDRISEQREISLRNARAVANLLSFLKDAETGQRGFLLTWRESYLEDYRRAIADSSTTLSFLARSVAPRPDQVKRVEILKPLLRVKLDELQGTIDLYRSKGADAAMAVVLTDESKNAMDQIRRICAEIQKMATDRFST